MTVLTLQLDGPDPELEATLATLPDAFTLTTRTQADICVVDMRRPSWNERAAAGAANAGMLFITGATARAGEADSLRELAKRVPVVIDLPWASNVALAKHCPLRLDDPATAVSVVASISPDRPVLSACADMLTACALVTGGELSLLNLSHDHNGITGHGSVNEVPLDLTLAVSTAATPVADIAVAGRNTHARVTLPDPITARPGHVRTTSLSGETLLPTCYESSRRTSLRRLIDARSEGFHPGHVETFAHALDLMSRALPGWSRLWDSNP